MQVQFYKSTFFVHLRICSYQSMIVKPQRRSRGGNFYLAPFAWYRLLKKTLQKPTRQNCVALKANIELQAYFLPYIFKCGSV